MADNIPIPDDTAKKKLAQAATPTTPTPNVPTGDVPQATAAAQAPRNLAQPNMAAPSAGTAATSASTPSTFTEIPTQNPKLYVNPQGVASTVNPSAAAQMAAAPQAPNWTTAPSAGTAATPASTPSATAQPNAAAQMRAPVSGINPNAPEGLAKMATGETLYGAPGQAPGTAPPGSTATVNPAAAAQRQAEFAANAAKRVPGAAPVAESVAGAAPAAAGESATLGSRLGSLTSAVANSRAAQALRGVAGRVAGRVGTGLGSIGGTLEALQAWSDYSQGNYANMVRHGTLGALDFAATKVPVAAPIAVGMHAIDAGATALGPKKIGGTINQIARNFGGGVNDDAELKINAAARLMSDPNISAATKAMLSKAGYSQLSQPTPGVGTAAAATPTAKPGAGNMPPVGQQIVPNGPNADNPATWSAPARAALDSTKPGTAVINGRVVSPAEINALANRNVISSENFTHPGIGTIGGIGQTPTFEQGAAMRMASANNGGGQRLPDLTGGIGAPQDARTQQFNDIANKITSLVGQGKRRGAKVLTELLGQVNQRNIASEAQDTQRDYPRPQTGAEEALALAQAGHANAAAKMQEIEAGQKAQIGAVQTQLANATDPTERKALENKLTALAGRASGEEKPASAGAGGHMKYQLPNGAIVDIPLDSMDAMIAKLQEIGEKKNQKQQAQP